eukprot:TRINITY_DN5200_c0_g1_i2.p1 TRINITY_DN5200_c0_g1~~TRINITY_DN5200_c0_g1_i2.p1  ORF type:complete len:346 (+),score=10.80 TRINITY_DN5200_c0_g1_i2:45-1082(+)
MSRAVDKYANFKPQLLEYLSRGTQVLCAIILLILVEGSFVEVFSGSIDTCVNNRELLKKEQSASYKFHRFLSPWVFRFTILSMVTFCLTLLINFSKSKISLNWRSLFAISYSALWYASAYCLLVAFKEFLKDTNCGSLADETHKLYHRNSISGHYSFHLYYICTLPFLAVTCLPWARSVKLWESTELDVNDHKAAKFIISLISYLIFVICSCITLYGTYYWGYHSLRQIYYGALFGVLSHLCMNYVLKNVFFRMVRDKAQKLIGGMTSGASTLLNCYQLLFLGLFQWSGFGLVYFFKGSLPFSSFEKWALLVIVWPTLLASTIFMNRVKLPFVAAEVVKSADKKA